MTEALMAGPAPVVAEPARRRLPDVANENRQRLALIGLGLVVFLTLFWLLSNWGEHFPPMLAGGFGARDAFNAVTLSLGLVLTGLVLLTILRCNAVLRNASVFSLERLIQLHRIIAKRTDVLPQLGALAGEVREAATRPRLPRFARTRLHTIASALDAAREDTDKAVRVFDAATQAPVPGDVPLRPVLQLCVTGLLFAGIIGTLYGLIGVFTPGIIGNVIKTAAERGDLEKPVTELVAQFGVAFGASLVAYVGYLFGRFCLDIADQAHDGVAGFLAHELPSRFRIILVPLQLDAVIDLPQRTRLLMEKQVEGLHAIVEDGKDQVTALRMLTSRLTKVAMLFNRATQRAAAATKKISDGLEQGRAEWTHASEVWQANTRLFAEQAAALSETMHAHTATLQATREAFDSCARQFDAEVRRMTEIWRENVSQIVQEIAQGVLQYNSTIQQSRDEIGGLLQQFETTRAMVEQGAEVVGRGQRGLEAAIDRIQAQQEETMRRLIAVLDGRAAGFGQALAPVAAEIGCFRNELASTLRGIGDLRAALLGDGRVDDLLTVLGRIDELLRSRAGLWQ